MRNTTHFVDIDGVIVRHLDRGSAIQWDTSNMILLNSTISTFDKWLGHGDEIILITARPEPIRKELEEWLRQHNVNYHRLLMDVNGGNRFFYNDRHPDYISGTYTLERNAGLNMINTGE